MPKRAPKPYRTEAKRQHKNETAYTKRIVYHLEKALKEDGAHDAVLNQRLFLDAVDWLLSNIVGGSSSPESRALLERAAARSASERAADQRRRWSELELSECSSDDGDAAAVEQQSGSSSSSTTTTAGAATEAAGTSAA